MSWYDFRLKIYFKYSDNDGLYLASEKGNKDVMAKYCEKSKRVNSKKKKEVFYTYFRILDEDVDLPYLKNDFLDALSR